MGAEAVVAAVVAGTLLLIAVIVVAPWRVVRRERALDPREYYALMAGEEPSAEEP